MRFAAHLRPNLWIGFDGQIVATWASETLERSSPTLYRPDGYVAFDAIVNWSPRWVPGLTLRASVLNFTDERYFRSLNGATVLRPRVSTPMGCPSRNSGTPRKVRYPAFFAGSR